MRATLAAVVATLVATACAGGSGGESSVRVYKPRGSLQCGSGGTPPAVMALELTGAGIPVRGWACGVDGLAHVAVCGAPDGAIDIFEIAASQADLARSLSFLPLDGLRSAREVACP